MPLPADDAEADVLLDFIALGDPNAKAFMRAIVELVYLADDAVDEDLPFAERQRMMVRQMWLTLVDLPRNPFWIQHQALFGGLIADILVNWIVSDNWKMHGDLRRKLFAYVRRENVDGIAVAVAAIVGGQEHARAVVEEIMRTCHEPTESFDDWCKEGRP